MDTLFTSLTHAVSGQPAVALAAAFAWGLASLLLSPCHLASIPLVVGFVSGQGQVSTARGVSIASLFSLGLLTTIAVIGGVTAAAGRMAGDVGPWANYAVAVVFFVVGLSLLDVVPLGWASPDTSRFRGRGLTAALVLGLVFGVALGPCTFAFMAPMLGVTFAVSGTSTLYGLLLIAAYGIGHCFVIVLAGGSTSWVRRYLRWTDASRGARVLRYASGVLVLVGGLYLVHTA
jgi:cytochrome c-type biogenesis protein